MQQQQRQQRGSLTVTVGPMFAGKSSEAKRQMRRHELARQSCLLIKHCSDDARLKQQDGDDEYYQTASGESYRCSPVYLHENDGTQGHTAVSVAELSKVPAELVAEADYVFVDEAQWFPDLVDIIIFRWVREQDKHVYAYGIDSDYRQRPMANMAVLMVWANTVHHRRAVCMRCGSETASLSVKKQEQRQGAPRLLAVLEEQGEQGGGVDHAIQPGGTEMYEACCLLCLDVQHETEPQRVMYAEGCMELFQVSRKQQGVVLIGGNDDDNEDDDEGDEC